MCIPEVLCYFCLRYMHFLGSRAFFAPENKLMRCFGFAAANRLELEKSAGNYYGHDSLKLEAARLSDAGTCLVAIPTNREGVKWIV